MLTLILEANHIPDDFLVRKPTGTKLYKKVSNVVIRGADSRVLNMQGVVYLISDNNIEAILSSTLLAIDFENIDALDQFVQELYDR